MPFEKKLYKNNSLWLLLVVVLAENSRKAYISCKRSRTKLMAKVVINLFASMGKMLRQSHSSSMNECGVGVPLLKMRLLDWHDNCMSFNHQESGTKLPFFCHMS
ncbi:hypothetical protein BOO22_17300 [Vibrio cidicii]|nr:hypothetical protein EA24_12630 [Vibrio navarrensis]MBG0761162.1 hypothetical protein [Vibrio cidicii]